jgi:hypothetical protein
MVMMAPLYGQISGRQNYRQHNRLVRDAVVGELVSTENFLLSPDKQGKLQISNDIYQQNFNKLYIYQRISRKIS